MHPEKARDLWIVGEKETVYVDYFDQKIFIDAEKKGDLDSPEYKEALDKINLSSSQSPVSNCLSHLHRNRLFKAYRKGAPENDLSRLQAPMVLS
jgi:hypothetical protein